MAVSQSSLPNQNPEQIARDAIDAQLSAAGWTVQAKDAIDFRCGEGQAVREYHTDSGPADYVLFVDGKPVGVIEAKKETLGHKITAAEDQTADYAAAVPSEFFDLLMIDECHRSIYNFWRQVLDHSVAFLVGITATPAARAYGFFRQNIVSGSTARMRQQPPNRRFARRASAGCVSAIHPRKSRRRIG